MYAPVVVDVTLVRDNGAKPNLAARHPLVGAIDLIQLVGLGYHLDLPFGSLVESFVKVLRSVLLAAQHADSAHDEVYG